MKNSLPILLVLFTLMFPRAGFPWGDEGHSVTAVIARDILVKEVKMDPRAALALKTVNSILGSTPIAEAAVWPDKVKTLARACAQTPYVKDPDYGRGKTKGKSSALCDAYKYTATWHFVSTDASEYVVTPTDPNYFKGDMVTVITELSHLLKGETPLAPAVSSIAGWKKACLSKSGHECKKEALEYVIHLVGDSHQPLHSGAECDVGGNAQQITFFGEGKDPDAYWCPPDAPADCSQHELHQAWDASLLLHGTQKENFSVNDTAADLIHKMARRRASSDAAHCVTAAPDSSFSADGANGPSGWVNESLCYMRQVYQFPDDPTLAQNRSSVKKRSVASDIPNRCRSDHQVGEGRDKHFTPVAIGQKYYDANIATIRERLYWGGSRLAVLLKDIYGTGDHAPSFDRTP